MTGGPNIYSTLSEARAYLRETKKGEAFVLELKFGDNYTHMVWPPRHTRGIAWDRQWFALVQVAEHLGVDVTLMPKCYGWEDFAEEFALIMKPAIGKSLFLKITKNARSYFCLGELPCCSHEPDLSFTDLDYLYFTPIEDDDISIHDMPKYDS